MIPSQVTAFCPGHISGYFRPVITDDPVTSGSCGGGIVINSGVTVIANSAEKTSVQVMQSVQEDSEILVTDNSPVINQLLEIMHVKASVRTFCSLPLSAGYGLSAAALLATVHAVNRLYNLSLSPEECAIKAHQVEVTCRTGLGDVAACQGGGWVVRKGPGIIAEITRFYSDQTIHALTLGPLKTSSVLTSPEMMNRIITAFPKVEPGDITGFFTCSRSFAEASGLISEEIWKVLIACDDNDIPASMTMLGNGIFALGDHAKDLLSRYGKVYSLQIAQTGPKILEIVS